MKPALLTGAGVFVALTLLAFALDGVSGAGDVLLDLVAGLAAGIAVFFGRTEPEGPERRLGLAVGAATVAIVVAVVAIRAAAQ